MSEWTFNHNMFDLVEAARQTAVIRKMLADIDSGIKEYGVSGNVVFSRTAACGPGNFGYTIGLNTKGWPEIVVPQMVSHLGYYYATAVGATILDDEDLHAIDQKQKWLLGNEITVPGYHDEDGDVRVSFRLPEKGDDLYLRMAHEYYKRRVPFLVAVFPGWPCPPCAVMDENAGECVCQFSCDWYYCSRLPASLYDRYVKNKKGDD